MLQGIPIQGIYNPLKVKKKGCPFCIDLSKMMCSSVGEDKECKQKVKEVEEAEIPFKDFLRFFREKYPEKAEEVYTEAVTKKIKGKESEKKTQKETKVVKELPYNPIPPIIGYPAGQSRVRKDIISAMPPHRRYVEPFGGGGSVLLGKEKSEEEIYNDLNEALTRFFECFKQAEKNDIEKCNMTPSKEKFEEKLKNFNKKKKCEDYLCDLFFLNYHSFNKQMQNYSSKQNCNNEHCGIKNVINHFDKLKERLKDVKIENKDFRETIKKYDSPETFFYLDPPYDPKKCLYGVGKSDKKLCSVTPEEVKEAIKDINGKFILQYHNDDYIKDVFRDFNIQPIDKFISSPQKKKYKTNELLISNFPLGEKKT